MIKKMEIGAGEHMYVREVSWVNNCSDKEWIRKR